jgi:Zinc carboxypeptidase
MPQLPHILVLTLILGALFLTGRVEAAPLSVDDFSFDGPLGCAGATIEHVGENHFQIVPGHAPTHPGWANMVQFTILRNAKGNALRIDVVDEAATSYMFNDYFYSWSYDGENWNPVHWAVGRKEKVKQDTLVFPAFTEDTVYVGHQVPISYEKLVTMMTAWEKHPHVTSHVIGQSLGKRNIYRLTVTDPDSPHPENVRWVHYFANQHPGEHNAQWRMAGMMDWLLSDAGADCRQRSICHFVFVTSPDAPSQGWYRVNAQGVDMNRSYYVDGADPDSQAHEACLVQSDLEKIMASDAPVTDLWSMHTWGGVVEPILHPGPEMTEERPWTLLRDIMDRNDPNDLVLPLAAKESTDNDNATQWTHGPHKQFGISAVLCEGAGNIYTKEENVASGVVLMKSLADYYGGTKNVP